MTITEITSPSQLPYEPLECYSLGKNDTEQTAYDQYRKKFGVEPERAWRWKNYIYIEMPKNDN